MAEHSYLVFFDIFIIQDPNILIYTAYQWNAFPFDEENLFWVLAAYASGL